MLNNRDIVDFLSDTMLVSNKRLFAVKGNLTVEQIDNQLICDSIQQSLNDYHTLSRYITNDYLIKPNTNSITTLYHINTDFNNLVDNSFKKQLVDIDGEKCLLIDTNTQYGTIIPNITLKRNYRKLKVDVRFSLQNLDTCKTLPKFVCEKKGEQNYYLAVPLENQQDGNTNTRQKKTFVFRTTLVFDSKTEGDQLKIYLWNTHKAKMLYDNLFVKIEEVE